MKTEPASTTPDYEPSDAHPRLVVGLGVLLFVLIGLGTVVGHLLLPSDRYASKSGGLPTDGPGPTDAADVQRAWDVQDPLVRSHLDRYAWIDRPKGVVQIPLDEAMRLQAAKGVAP